MKKWSQWAIPALAGALLMGTGGVASVHAQDAANPFIGKWKVEWQGEKKSQEADLEITASGGTWQTATSKRKDPCIGREAPVEIKSVNAEMLKFTAKFSEALAGCKDANMTLTRAADGKVSGTRGDAELTLTRK